MVKKLNTDKVWGSLVFFGLFLGLAVSYFVKKARFAGIESWPSVEAEIVASGNDILTFPIEGPWVAKSTSFDAGFVEFRYTVEEKSLVGRTATPDGGGLPYNPERKPWRAYYKPSDPGTAVLVPTPYQGTELLVWVVFSGVLAGAYLWFAFLSKFFMG
ncbi:MAG: DUF3592 domain-containing protein [Verrucomicrobiae bacterium]|nr:DUF3592 domain-containing protein [Verrucomicrobiae bacterium]